MLADRSGAPRSARALTIDDDDLIGNGFSRDILII
jgi:hypothetical protein